MLLQCAPGPSAVSDIHSALTLVPAWILTARARKELSKQDDQLVIRKHLVPALHCFLQARSLCPLLPEPHRFLANHVDKLEQADARIAYLDRAALLIPYDPGIWYLCGKEIFDRDPAQACKYWNRSLQLSDRYLSPILQKSVARLGPSDICRHMLPPNPTLLFKAAMRLYPEARAERQPFLKEALDLLERESSRTSARELHVKALILCDLNRSGEALTAYQAALIREPRQTAWRLEFARILYQQKRLRESRRELLLVLSQKPDHPDARELLGVVERKLAETM
jgi:tetratricopeptide (TPR) repeat protein